MVSFPLFFVVLYMCAYRCDAAPSHPEIFYREVVDQTSLNQEWYSSRVLDPPFESYPIETDKVIDGSVNEQEPYPISLDEESATQIPPVGVQFGISSAPRCNPGYVYIFNACRPRAALNQ